MYTVAGQPFSWIDENRYLLSRVRTYESSKYIGTNERGRSCENARTWTRTSKYYVILWVMSFVILVLRNDHISIVFLLKTFKRIFFAWETRGRWRLRENICSRACCLNLSKVYTATGAVGSVCKVENEQTWGAGNRRHLELEKESFPQHTSSIWFLILERWTIFFLFQRFLPISPPRSLLTVSNLLFSDG